MKYLGYIFPSLGFMLNDIARRYGSDVRDITRYQSRMEALAVRIEKAHYEDLVALARPALPFLLFANIPFLFFAVRSVPADKWLIPYFCFFFTLNIIVVAGVFVFERLITNWRLRARTIDLTVILFFTSYGFGVAYFYQFFSVAETLVVHMICGGIIAITATITAPPRWLFPGLSSGLLLPQAVYFYQQTTPLLSSLGILVFIYYGILLLFNHIERIRRTYDTTVRLLGVETNKKVSRTHRKLEATNETIANGFDKLRLIKEKQAGDYFLTSLLIEPLAGQFPDSQKIRVEGFTRQTKQFRFKGRRQQLGGDMNIVDRIILNGETFLVAINADAMGIGMHGAGGAIVFGTSMRSILLRTKRNQPNILPSDWLRTVVHELNQIFFEFKGAMTVRYLVTIIHEETGQLYFVNVAGPPPILMTGSMAAGNRDVHFIKHPEPLPDAGMAVIPKHFPVGELILASGQSFLMASDGRDNILWPGQNLLQPKPSRIVHILRESDNDLIKLYRSLLAGGLRNDDISFLKLEHA